MGEKNYYIPPPPLNKPEKPMKLCYMGESFGVDGLTNGKIYEAWFDLDWPEMLRVIDDSDEDYLYSPSNPAPWDGSSPGGRWEIVEANDEDAKKMAYHISYAKKK